MNLKRIIVDTDNGERLIYEDFHIDNYVEIGEERYSPPWLAQVADKDSWAFDLRLRAGKLTVTEALPGNTDYDWLLERYKLLRKDLDQAKAMYQEFVDGVAAALGFDEERADLKQQIKDLNRENRTLQDIIDSHWDGDW